MTSSTVAKHYETLLAKHYEWMVGEDFEERVEGQRLVLEDAGVGSDQVVVDLGCGPGYQSFAASKLGVQSVVAVDTSEFLLNRLKARLAGEPIRTVHSEMLKAAEALPHRVDAFLCMGDTLPHLASKEHVWHLIEATASKLVSGGLLVLSYRDLSNVPHGVDRFIPVRSSANKIMTCFLEDVDNAVVVHDLIYSREDTGWELNKSAYQKQVIPIAELLARLASQGYHLEGHEVHSGMHTIVAIRKARTVPFE